MGSYRVLGFCSVLQGVMGLESGSLIIRAGPRVEYSIAVESHKDLKGVLPVFRLVRVQGLAV